MLHQGLTESRWQKLSFADQMANIGAEIGRAISWKIKDIKKSEAALQRGIELLDLTIQDPKNRKGRLKELCRLKEFLGDYFIGENQYGSDDKKWNDYFYAFNFLAAVKNGR